MCILLLAHFFSIIDNPKENNPDLLTKELVTDVKLLHELVGEKDKAFKVKNGFMKTSISNCRFLKHVDRAWCFCR